MNRTVRKIVHIDESKCNGCGTCALKCAEGALQIIDGKAKLLSDNYCDGLGACLGECPQGAIKIEERPAGEFDEKAVESHLKDSRHTCPGSTVQELASKPSALNLQPSTFNSRLSHWPVQMTLVPPGAPFLKNVDIALIADCVPFAYPNLHEDFLKGRAVLVACPKLDNFEAHLEKLTQILLTAKPKSLTVVHMEVPCCSGLVHMAKRAAAKAKAIMPVKELTIGINGKILK
jgi:Pyruvate/2-oxoacid:ferredoxin oxidoreductase delta subunit